MDALRTPPAVAAFLAVIHDCGADTATQTVLCRSISAWAPSYHYFRTALGGNCPPLLARQGHSARFAQAVLGAARTVLEGIADTFRCFFHLPWTRLEVSHAHLTATFLRLCAAYRLAGDTDDLYARMRALHTRLRAFRQAYRSPPDAVSTSPETLHEVVTDLEQYIIGMLTFFERHIPHSILCSGTCTLVERAPQERFEGQDAIGHDKAQSRREPYQRARSPTI